MEPTVEAGDRILVNKLAYGFKMPFTKIYLTGSNGLKLGDVVVLDSPEDDKTLLKRVVGLAGQTISVVNGIVFVDGKNSNDEMTTGNATEITDGKHHLLSLEYGSGDDWGPKIIPEGKVLVMGDNRGNSHDGRHFGLIEKNTIRGKAEKIYWRQKLRWIDL